MAEFAFTPLQSPSPLVPSDSAIIREILAQLVKNGGRS